MCLPNILSPVFMLAFILRCRSFSPCWPLAFLIVSQLLWIFMFFFLQNSTLLFSITCSNSFSVIHVSVNIKNNVEKERTLLLFSLLSKTLSCNWVAIPVDWIILHWYASGADGRSGGRAVYGHVTTKFSPIIVYHIFFTQVLRFARFARFARECSAKNRGIEVECMLWYNTISLVCFCLQFARYKKDICEVASALNCLEEDRWKEKACEDHIEY